MDDLRLTKDGSKLLIKSNGSLRIGTDCCCLAAVLIYNANSAVDDNFKVVLNGDEIGTIDNNSNTCTGRIFAEALDITATSYAMGITCGTPNFQATVLLASSHFVNGLNTLRVESIQDNNNGNFGTVQVLGLQKSGASYVLAKTYLNSSYSFPDGVSNGQDYTFTYP